MPIVIKVRDERAKAYLRNVRDAFQKGLHMEVLKKVAWESFARLVIATPKGYTGNTRQSWKVIPVPNVGYIVTNVSKVMLFLELGTKAHGPVKAKFLFIPLNRSAAIGGWTEGMVYGTDYVLAKRVRGMQALGIVASERVTAKAALRQGMLNFIRGIVSP